MEIERKFLFTQLPGDEGNFRKKELMQAYLSVNPVVRIRREDDHYELTIKGKGLMAREEYTLPLSKESFDHLMTKHDGRTISKTRYLIPLENGLTAEADIFHGDHDGKRMVEVEFPSVEAAESFIPPSWFNEEVTNDPAWHNANMI